MKVKASIETKGVRQALQAMVDKQVPFATALALTRLAAQARKDVQGAMPTVFDRPNPFTIRGVRFKMATRKRLYSVVYIAEKQAKYLAIQEFGGTRTPMRGSPLNMPYVINTNQYGNISRKNLKNLLAKPNTFTIGKGHPYLPPGIYRRNKRRRATARSMPIRLMVVLGDVQQYEPRFGFADLVMDSARKNFKVEFSKAIADAIKSGNRPFRRRNRRR